MNSAVSINFILNEQIKYQCWVSVAHRNVMENIFENNQFEGWKDDK